MSHLAASEIVSLRDREEGTLADHRQEHLASCSRCREALDRARSRARLIAAALPESPDIPQGELQRARRAVRARLDGQGPGARTSGRVAPVAGGFWSLSRAATLLLLLAGGAAALPGSPVRQWVDQALGGPPVATEAPVQEGVEAMDASGSETGVRLRVEEGPVEVSVTGLGPGTRIEVTRTGIPELAVFAPDGSRFRSAEGRVNVSSTGGPVRIRLPSGATPATLRVEGRVYLRWTSAGPEIHGPVVERGDERIVFEVGG